MTVSQDEVDQMVEWMLIRATRQAERQLSADLSAFDLTPVQFGVLAQLSAAGPLTQAGLARAIEVRPQSAAGVVKGMVDRGLVARASDPRRGHRNEVALTPRGTKVFAKAWAEVGGDAPDRYAALSPADRRELRRLLGMMLAADGM